MSPLNVYRHNRRSRPGNSRSHRGGRTGEDQPAEAWLARAKRKPLDELVEGR
jgi:hypothetical protein